MTLEDQHTDRKSLRTVIGKTADWDALAKDCVCFANGAGGRLLIGIEDGEALPPAGQVVPSDLLDRLRKRIGELTVNEQALPSLQRAANGGEFIELVVDRAASVAASRSQLKRALTDLAGLAVVLMEGERNGARYTLVAEK